MKELIGNWGLLSYVTEAPDGTTGKPYGDAIGRLSYDGNGNMAGHVMRPGRSPVVHGETGLAEVRAAYAGYIAYFGTYEVNADRDTVIHHVEGALNPAWIGGDQVRNLRFDGELLVLSTDVPKAGTLIRHTLTWRRIG